MNFCFSSFLYSSFMIIVSFLSCKFFSKLYSWWANRRFKPVQEKVDSFILKSGGNFIFHCFVFVHVCIWNKNNMTKYVPFEMPFLSDIFFYVINNFGENWLNYLYDLIWFNKSIIFLVWLANWIFETLFYLREKHCWKMMELNIV